jgi:cation diffusion facilitator family transporter
MIVLKSGAHFITRSAAPLSDAPEFVVNLPAALLALFVLTVVAQPPDEEHAYGHEKAEYFSSGVEGALILIAALVTAYNAVERLLNPVPLEQLNLGLAIALVASVINFIVARVLLRVGREARSVALEADGVHLMTDVWTSGAVLLGVGLVALTGWSLLDPLVALGAAAHIGWSGVRLVRRSALGLMDTALEPELVEMVEQVLEQHRAKGVQYHALRTRQAGARSFVSLHVQVPGDWSVQQGHDLMERIEAQIRAVVPSAVVFTHIEPLEDPRSWRDEQLDRPLPESES